MASLLERLAADEAAARQRLADLQQQVAVLQERLSELAIARKVVEPLLAQQTTPQDPLHHRGNQDQRPVPHGSAAEPRQPLPAGPRELAGIDKRVVVVMASAGRPMRAKEVTQALGEPQTRGRVESTRARLKKLVAAGWLTQHEPGLFAITAGINGPAMKGAAESDNT